MAVIVCLLMVYVVLPYKWEQNVCQQDTVLPQTLDTSNETSGEDRIAVVQLPADEIINSHSDSTSPVQVVESEPVEVTETQVSVASISEKQATEVSDNESEPLIDEQPNVEQLPVITEQTPQVVEQR